MSSNSVRVSAELFEQAQRQGGLMCRSTAQQIEHWARLGAALEVRGLAVADMAQLLQVLHEPRPTYAQASESELWANKRRQQAQDLARAEAGEVTQDELSWFANGRARAAVLPDSPF